MGAGDVTNKQPDHTDQLKSTGTFEHTTKSGARVQIAADTVVTTEIANPTQTTTGANGVEVSETAADGSSRFSTTTVGLRLGPTLTVAYRPHRFFHAQFDANISAAVDVSSIGSPSNSATSAMPHPIFIGGEVRVGGALYLRNDNVGVALAPRLTLSYQGGFTPGGRAEVEGDHINKGFAGYATERRANWQALQRLRLGVNLLEASLFRRGLPLLYAAFGLNLLGRMWSTEGAIKTIPGDPTAEDVNALNELDPKNPTLSSPASFTFTDGLLNPGWRLDVGGRFAFLEGGPTLPPPPAPEKKIDVTCEMIGRKGRQQAQATITINNAGTQIDFNAGSWAEAYHKAQDQAGKKAIVDQFQATINESLNQQVKIDEKTVSKRELVIASLISIVRYEGSIENRKRSDAELRPNAEAELAKRLNAEKILKAHTEKQVYAGTMLYKVTETDPKNGATTATYLTDPNGNSAKDCLYENFISHVRDLFGPYVAPATSAQGCTDEKIAADRAAYIIVSSSLSLRRTLQTLDPQMRKNWITKEFNAMRDRAIQARLEDMAQKGSIKAEDQAKFFETHKSEAEKEVSRNLPDSLLTLLTAETNEQLPGAIVFKGATDEDSVTVKIDKNLRISVEVKGCPSFAISQLGITPPSTQPIRPEVVEALIATNRTILVLGHNQPNNVTTLSEAGNYAASVYTHDGRPSSLTAVEARVDAALSTQAYKGLTGFIGQNSGADSPRDNFIATGRSLSGLQTNLAISEDLKKKYNPTDAEIKIALKILQNPERVTLVKVSYSPIGGSERNTQLLIWRGELGRKVVGLFAGEKASENAKVQWVIPSNHTTILREATGNLSNFPYASISQSAPRAWVTQAGLGNALKQGSQRPIDEAGEQLLDRRIVFEIDPAYIKQEVQKARNEQEKLFGKAPAAKAE